MVYDSFIQIVPVAIMDAGDASHSFFPARGVSHVFGMSNGPQIAPSVVIPNPIDVVDFVKWVFARHHLPRNPMADKAALVYANTNVTTVGFVPDWLSRIFCVPSHARRFGRMKARLEHVWRSVLPDQRAAVLVIGKQRVQKVCRWKYDVVHDGLRLGHCGKRVQVLEYLHPHTVYHGGKLNGTA